MFNIICVTISILCGLSFIELLYPHAKNLSNQLYQVAILTTAFLVGIKYYFGPDIMIYVPMYEEIQTPIELLHNSESSEYEIGFLFYISICQHWLKLNFWSMTLIITILYFFALHLIIRKLPALKTFALFSIIFLQTNLIFFEYRQCTAWQACLQISTQLGPSAGVMPVKWTQSAPSKILSQSKSSGLASWIAE